MISRFDASGKLLACVQFDGVLAVDIAESASGQLAVALAGSLDQAQPRVVLAGAASLPVTPPTGAIAAPGPVPMSADGTSGMLGVLQFDPSLLDQAQAVPKGSQSSCFSGFTPMVLPGPATAVATRSFIATRVLASLVPRVTSKGGDDGHVWHFVDQGPRRTQSMFVGLEGTAPFHWVGDMNDLGTLMENVFVGRMGGVHQSAQRFSALVQWLYASKAPPALRSASDPAVARGHALFEGEAECSKCHSGAKLTNNMTVDVGTGLPLQVPSLIAVAYRGPWLHTGCAATLHDRFNPECGGASHGKTAQLAATQIDDLVAYLESL